MNEKEFLDMSEYDRFCYVRYMDDDLLKLKYLPYIQSETYVALIIASMHSNKIKEQYINSIHDDYNIYLIVKSFSLDLLKYRYLSFISNEELRLKTLLTITSDDYKEEFVTSFQSVFYKSKLIASFKSDDLKKKYLKLLSGVSLRNVVVSMSSDLDKIEYLSLLEDGDKARVIAGFQSDELKMRYLDCILSEEEKIDVISSFKDVSYMASLLNTIRDSVIRDSIIELIPDYLRMQLITFTYGHLRSVLVASLNDDYLKLRYLDCVDDKMIVYMSFGDDLKEKYINQVDSYLDKMALIYSFHNPLKRKYYEKKYQKDLSFDLEIDPLLQFGLEIEAEGVNEKIFLNISSSNEDYRVTRDGTLILGVEVKTPKLRNNHGNLSKLYYICNALEKAGFISSSRTGGHIHFDASYFTCKEDYYGLFEIWTSVEEILYLILNDVGSIPRWDVSGFATSFVDSLNGQKEVVCESFYKEDEEFIKDLHLWQDDKNNGLNLTHVQSGTNTIEFRVPNGTVSFPVWVQNIKLLGRLMMVSKRLSSFYKNHIRSSLWDLKEQLLEDRCEDEKLELLLNLLFKEEEKDVYRKRYYVNKSLLNEENNPLGKMHFESMNLTRKKFKFY